MAFVKLSGQPFVGYVSLTNGAPGPTAVTITTVPGGGAYTLQSTERLIVTNLTITTNDAATPLITLDDGATTPRTLAKIYASTSQPATTAGGFHGQAGKPLRASASAVTAGKTIEVIVRGYVSVTV